MMRFSFQEPPEKIAFVKPKAVRIGTVRWDVKSWTQLVVVIVKALLWDKRYRKEVQGILENASWASKTEGDLRRPVPTGDGVWLEGNLPAGNMVGHLKKLLTACGYPPGGVEVECKDGGQGEVHGHPRSKTVGKRGAFSTRARKFRERIGAYAKRELYAALEEGRIPDGDFSKLKTMAGTKELLGVTLTGCPLFGDSPLVRPDGRIGSWKGAATREGKPVFVNSQWYAEYRRKLECLLKRWKTPPHTFPSEGNDDRLTGARTVLERCFPDGIRPASIIDRNKFAKGWETVFGTPMPAGMDLAAILPFVGVTHGDKVFPPAGAEGKTVADFAMEIAEQANGPVFYDCLFESEAERLTKMGVQSGAMLRDHLRHDTGGRMLCGKNSFSRRRAADSVEDAVAGAFAEKPTWTRQELEERFPYVPGDRLVAVLAQESRFVRIAEGEYRLASAILLDEEECEEAARRVAEGIREDGFFSMADCTFERSMERNGNIYLSALQTRFFDEWLAGRYSRHGQIVCEERAKYDSRAEVRRFCRSRDEATLKQLLELEETSGLGGGNRVLATAYEEMVRVSSDRFVAPRLVTFDVAGADAALDNLVPGSGVMPLAEMDSFVTFPPVDGWPWNGYLLESYLRRESKDFKYLSVSDASRTLCGAIVRRSAGFETVVDALAMAALEASVEPTEKAVGEFLRIKGFIQRRRGVEKDVAEALLFLHKKHPAISTIPVLLQSHQGGH